MRWLDMQTRVTYQNVKEFWSTVMHCAPVFTNLAKFAIFYTHENGEFATVVYSLQVFITIGNVIPKF